MGAYSKKSYSLGPFRLNLSKSGLGLSFGVTGLRVGAGQNGPYIHAGRGGLYFKKSLKNLDEKVISENTENCNDDDIENIVPQKLSPFKKILKYVGNFLMIVIIVGIILISIVFYVLFSIISSSSKTNKKPKINRRSYGRRL